MTHDGDNQATAVAAHALRVIPAVNRWAQSSAVQNRVAGNLSLRQLRALFLIRSRPMTLGDLARALIVTPAVVTGLVDRLEKRGYVRRVAGSGDRRRILLEPTELGAEASERVQRHLVERLALVLEDLSPEELATIEAAMTILEHALPDLEAQLAPS